MNDYFCIDVENMYSSNYALYRDNNLISYTGDNCKLAFEENGIAPEFQKIYIGVNKMKGFLSKRVIGAEYLTNIPMVINKNEYCNYTVSGNMAIQYPGFRFTNARHCDNKEILEFLADLEENEMLEDYMESLSEIFQINIKTNKTKRK